MAAKSTPKSSRKKPDSLLVLAFVFLVVGALNWGLVGLVNINLVNYVFGPWPELEKIIYLLIGLSGLYKLYLAWSKK